MKLKYLVVLNGKFVGDLRASSREAANRLAQAMYGLDAYVV